MNVKLRLDRPHSQYKVLLGAVPGWRDKPKIWLAQIENRQI